MSDIAYALLTGYGMSFVFDYINKNIFYLQLLGSIMLLLFGIYTFRSNPVQSIRPASSSKGSYFHNFITAFFVTLSNPLIIFLFIGPAAKRLVGAEERRAERILSADLCGMCETRSEGKGVTL